MAHSIKLNTDRVTKYFRATFFIGGLWKPLQQSQIIQFLYNVFSVINLFTIAILFTVSLVVNLVFNMSSSRLTDRLVMSAEEVAFCCKAINIFINNANCQKIRESLNDFTFLSASEERPIRKKMDAFMKAMFVYWLITNFAIISWNVNVIMMGSQKLVFSGWYPGFDWENNRFDYWTVFTYQFISLTLTANVNVICDLYYAFAMYVNSLKLQVLGERLSSMQLDRANAKSLQLMEETLIGHIKTYQKIGNAINILAQDLKWAYFSQVLLSTLVICAGTNEIAKVFC